MFQHLIVTLVFALCLYFVVWRVIRIVSQAKKDDSRCVTCTETSCPLKKASSTMGKCNCGCH